MHDNFIHNLYFNFIYFFSALLPGGKGGKRESERIRRYRE